MGRCTPHAQLAAVPLLSDVIGEKITFAHLSECDPEPGFNILYLATGDGELADDAKKKAQEFCDRYLRGSGTTLTVSAPQKKTINLACTVEYTGGTVNKARVKAELRRVLVNYVRGMEIGGEQVGLGTGSGYVFLNRLIKQALEVPGIQDISFDSISANVIVETNRKPWTVEDFTIQEAE
jgi:hypothetical protein